MTTFSANSAHNFIFVWFVDGKPTYDFQPSVEPVKVTAQEAARLFGMTLQAIVYIQVHHSHVALESTKKNHPTNSKWVKSLEDRHAFWQAYRKEVAPDNNITAVLQEH